MMRPTRLERRLAKALDPVVDRLDELAETVSIDLAVANQTAVTRVADAERRVAATQTQAEARVAAVRAELADARKESISDAFAKLRQERDAACRALSAKRNQDAEQAGLIAELERRLEVLTYERDAARRNADDANLCVESWSASWHGLRAQIDDLRAAVVPVMPDAHRGVEARPRGGSKTKARRRLAELTALVEPEVADSA